MNRNDHEITAIDLIAAFIFGGHAIFTLTSRKTGARFTYRVTKGEPRGNQTAPYFVGVLAGPDNYHDYSYLGLLTSDGRLIQTQGSRISFDAPSAKAFQWLLKCIDSGSVESVKFQHEGSCARCGRKLTVPSSIEIGFGPVCAGKSGL